MGSHTLLVEMVKIIMRRFAVLIALTSFAAPASAQVDLTGTWQRVSQQDNGAANEPVDLLGMPLSADGRAKALSYDIASLSATERQCQMYPPIYAIVGPFPLQFVMVPDPVTQKLIGTVSKTDLLCRRRF